MQGFETITTYIIEGMKLAVQASIGGLAIMVCFTGCVFIIGSIFGAFNEEKGRGNG